MTNIFVTDHTADGLEVQIHPRFLKVDRGRVALVFEYRKDAQALGETLLREVEEDLVETTTRSFVDDDYAMGNVTNEMA